ncbi:Rv1355c family protein [Dyadobacter sp. LHD-138]|uniref:Rv1355c family protein n=1 Tax=Dyadobacter sp. LHD-138 TaxID=3071413 RepID=UPI0027DFC71F|nr:Rv1355c family protein [Dyadobacter sp. LHD-138]MDQ6480755.1 Rv1355c family protein [Dyadobacter sp. LHD-138]
MYHDLELSKTYLPVFFELSQEADKQKFDEIISANTDKIVLDLFSSQKKELFKVRNPKKKLSAADTDALYTTWIKGKTADHEGIWVYYPWLNRLIHILNREEFIELRTSRNQFKITPTEQQSLFSKTIGIIGLSVGHAVALSVATERICSKLKIADFDTIELSNLNRIKTGIQNIGLNKCVVTAREIAEIDPFIEIECYLEGVTEDNIEAFLLEGGKLDILVDECDELDIKLLCRNEAKKYRIPVLMETSDRGMLDVERFDIEPDRPIFHGLIGDLDPAKMKNLSNEQKIPLIIKIVDAKNSSLRGRVSLLEVGQSIGTWPQLASSVTLGGGVVTDVARRILLNQYKESGRYYVDTEAIIRDKTIEKADTIQNPFQPFNLNDAAALVASFDHQPVPFSPDIETIEEIVKAACQAPSTGNDQPWKWLYREGTLFLFHDMHRAYSFGNFDNIASNISFGAAFENIILKSHQLGLYVKKNLYPLDTSSALVATIQFSETPDEGFEKVFSPESVNIIYDRCTNRNPSEAVPISSEDFDALKAAAESVTGAGLIIIKDAVQMDALAEIIGACDRIRLLNKNGHKDFVHKEMKWTREEAENSADGIDIQTLGMDSSQLAALSLLKDKEIVQVLKSIDGGKALIDVSRKVIESASALGIITLPDYNPKNFFEGGISLERLWLKAEMLGYAIHPLISPFYLFPRVLHGSNEGLDDDEGSKLLALRQNFLNVIPLRNNMAEVFLFKIAKAEKPVVKSLRLPFNETFHVVDKKS